MEQSNCGIHNTAQRGIADLSCTKPLAGPQYKGAGDENLRKGK